MHAGRNFPFLGVLLWTRRDIYFFFVISAIPTTLYELLGWTWLPIPWVPIAMVGTAVAFITGFKNNASYDRMWEARQIYGAIVNSSRSWGIMVIDFVTPKHVGSAMSESELRSIHASLIHRHLAWLHALRYQLRMVKPWENIVKKHNTEYRDRYFKVEEQNGDMAPALAEVLNEAECAHAEASTNAATQIIAMQSKDLKALLQRGLIEDFRHMELEKMLVDFYTQQGKCERIKNFPYPRQFATANMVFVKIFLLLVPFGMLGEFAEQGDGFVWLTIPFSILVCWIFNTMEKIGESTENPFEGGANDVPITAITRTIEIDLREMLGEKNIPAPLKPVNDILM